MEGASAEILNTKMEFAVDMNSPCCAEKLKRALDGAKGIRSVDVDLPAQRLVVEGNILAERVRDTVEKQTGMAAVLLGHGSSTNLGAGVAAISVGSSGVQGLLRFVQVDGDRCFVEGTLDKLPTSEPVFLTVHETGDVSQGCYSCGSLLTGSEASGQAFAGILMQLSPNKDKRAEFRTAISNVNLSDLFGHCVVVHKGSHSQVQQGTSQRLACGIVARASGLFQNSKRFCACDGVTIWEQRQLGIDNGKL